MKTKTLAVIAAAGLSACAHVNTENKVGLSILRLDSKNSLAVRVGGVEASPAPVEYPMSQNGAPVHRVLHGKNGEVLFAYDLQPARSTGGEYHFLLKPAASGPTFDSVRQVTVRGNDLVKVELMEDGSGRKIEDIFNLLPAEHDQRGADPNSTGAPFAHVHAFLRHLFHGE